MKEYSQFIDTVRAHADEADPIKKAVGECIERGILARYLERKGSEVRNMLVAEYSYEEDIRVKQEEARVEGLEQGIGALVQDNLEEGVPKERILEKLYRRFSLDPEQAEEHYRRYSGL